MHAPTSHQRGGATSPAHTLGQVCAHLCPNEDLGQHCNGLLSIQRQYPQPVSLVTQHGADKLEECRALDVEESGGYSGIAKLGLIGKR